MTYAQFHPNLAAFVLGGLEPEEAAAVRRHLASCPDCRNELRELEEVNRALEAGPPPADPPGYLKDEILSRVRAGELSSISERSSSSRNPHASEDSRSRSLRFVLPSVAAVALVATITLGIVFGLREEAPLATIRLLPTPEEASELEGYWGVAEIYPQPSGNQQVKLKLNNFDEPKPNSYYEVWFVSGDRRISAGSFTSVGEGGTRVWLTVPPEARNYPTLLITEERVDGDPAPSEGVALKGEMS